MGALRLEGRGERRANVASGWEHRAPGPDRRSLRIIVLVGALLVIALLVYRQIDRWRGDVIILPVAAADLVPGTRIEPDTLGQREMRSRDIPDGVALDAAAIAGRVLATPKAAGSPFFRDDFAPPDLGPGLAGILPAGKVLVFARISDLPMAEIVEQLRFGDRLDVVAVGPLRGGGFGAISVAQGAHFVGWIEEREAEGSSAAAGGGLGATLSQTLTAEIGGGGRQTTPPLLLAVQPADAVALTEAQAARVPLSLVVHGRAESASGQLLDLPRVRVTEVEMITGAARQKVPIDTPSRRRPPAATATDPVPETSPP